MAEGSTWPPHATRFLETTHGILSYAQLAPLLAERVLRVLQDIEDGVFAARPLDESLLVDLHRNICGDVESLFELFGRCCHSLYMQPTH